MKGRKGSRRMRMKKRLVNGGNRKGDGKDLDFEGGEEENWKDKQGRSTGKRVKASERMLRRATMKLRNTG